MPELPEVESARKLVAAHCIDSKISTVHLLEQGNGPRHGLFDDIVCETIQTKADKKDSYSSQSTTLPPLTAIDFENALLNRYITSVQRKGKQLWFELSDNEDNLNPYCILFHFGMTGSFVVKGVEAPSYMDFKIHDSTWPPKFTKFEIIFDNGIQLAFTDPRRLGRIRLRHNHEVKIVPPISKLAFDPLLDLEEFTLDYMKVTLAKYSCPIKALLLDQEKMICGIGNWVADEVLYQSGIHPSKSSISLTTDEIELLYQKILHVLQTAVSLNAESKDFPTNWLFHYRWSKKNGEKVSPLKMPNGDSIIFETIGGRTSAIVQSSSNKKVKANSSKNSNKSKNKPEVAAAIYADKKTSKKKVKVENTDNSEIGSTSSSSKNTATNQHGDDIAATTTKGSTTNNNTPVKRKRKNTIIKEEGIRIEDNEEEEKFADNKKKRKSDSASTVTDKQTTSLVPTTTDSIPSPAPSLSPTLNDIQRKRVTGVKRKQLLALQQLSTPLKK